MSTMMEMHRRRLHSSSTDLRNGLGHLLRPVRVQVTSPMVCFSRVSCPDDTEQVQ